MKTYSRKNSSYLKKAFIASNFNEMCRLCLSEVDKVLTPIIQDNKISYQEWIHYGVDVLIEEGDGLPPNICVECLAMVEQTYIFKKKCKASDSKLREHLELLEYNEECKLNKTSFSLFQNENSNKGDESSAVDSGGTETIKTSFKAILTSQEDNTEENSEIQSLNINERVNLDEPNYKKFNESNLVQKLTHEVSGVELEETQVTLGQKEDEASPIKDDFRESQLQPKKIERLKEVKRYILKGEKKNDEQEEDLTVCEVIPLDCPEELLSESSKNSNFITLSLCSDLKGQESLNMDESNNSGDVISDKNSDTRIQEIYKLWGSEEEGDEQVVEVGNTNEKIMVFDITWKGDAAEEDGGKDSKTTLVETKQNGVVVQTHKVYTNKNHIEIIETIPQTKCFKCFYCDEYFTTIDRLKDHLAKIHNEVSDVPYCPVCGKHFTCANSLKRHMAVHTGFKPYKCKVCGRKFSQGSILKRHILTHESLKPFKCHICQKSYTQKMNLFSHMKNHGFKTGAENFNCKLCNKSFVHQSGLSRHLKLHKGVKFLCVHCKKSFADASALARHVKTFHQNLT